MSRDTKRKVSKWTMIICLTIVACFYIYPVFLMVMNSFKPFGEIIGDVLALLSVLTFPTTLMWWIR